jgi:YD repeat-containing protein
MRANRHSCPPERPSSVVSPFGAQTNYTYGWSNGLRTATAVLDGRWTRTTKDGLGRTIKVENGTGATTTPAVSQTDTAYDSCGCSPLGKLKQTSLPHAPASGAAWTTYTYDGIGRTLSVQAPDGASTTTYSYQGNLVTVTDPAGSWKKYTSDAFGRLSTVEEPNPAGGSYFTTYTYDRLDHLTNVSMPRPTGTQTRTFAYNNTAFLQSATNPENGTVTYTYDSQKRLSSVVDAKNQKKVLTYDTYNRVTQVQRYVYSGGAYVEDPMQRTNFYYDSNPPRPGGCNLRTAVIPCITAYSSTTFSNSGFGVELRGRQKSSFHIADNSSTINAPRP